MKTIGNKIMMELIRGIVKEVEICMRAGHTIEVERENNGYIIRIISGEKKPEHKTNL